MTALRSLGQTNPKGVEGYFLTLLVRGGLISPPFFQMPISP